MVEIVGGGRRQRSYRSEVCGGGRSMVDGLSDERRDGVGAFQKARGEYDCADSERAQPCFQLTASDGGGLEPRHNVFVVASFLVDYAVVRPLS